jgi:hypothetical protein
MLYTTKTKASFSASLLVCISALAATPRQPQILVTPHAGFAKVQTVVLAEILKNPKRFDGQLIRVVASHHNGFESSALVDDSLTDENQKTFWVELHKSCNRRSNKQTMATFHQNEGCTRIQAVGRISVARRILNPNSTPVPVAGNSGFGHLNAYPFLFTVMTIERAVPCP